MKNFTEKNKKWIVELNGDLFEITPTKKLKKYFENPECTCRVIPNIELQTILIGGSDDCPIHGFGIK